MYKRACSLKSWARNGCGDETGTYLVQGNIYPGARMDNMEQAEIKKQHGVLRTVGRCESPLPSL